MSTKISTTIAIILAAAWIVKAFQSESEWLVWKAQHMRRYASVEEEMKRHKTWLQNKQFVDQHNSQADAIGYHVAMNHFSDLTLEEFLERYAPRHSNVQPRNASTNVKAYSPPVDLTYPDKLDWRTRGAVTSVKSQGQCSASYAFAATGVLEGVKALTSDQLLPLSEQNIIDCSGYYGNSGCSSGETIDALRYVVDNGGIDTSSSYPYQEKQGTCHFSRNSTGVTASWIMEINGEDDLKSAVTTMGPIAVTVDATCNGFRFYSYGVFSSHTCSSTYLNHAMLVTGYGVSSAGKEYWLVKNSWGTNWGLSGYILMSRGKYNQCGIASKGIYAGS
ncbi:hypothetical protein EMCRGX_G010237 [Ephydatia muelleri]